MTMGTMAAAATSEVQPGQASAGAELILARPGELWLKGRNRRAFERRLAANVRHALRHVPEAEVAVEYDQIVVRCGGRAAEIASRLLDVFGISSLVPAWGAGRDPDEIAAVAHRVLGAALEARPAGPVLPFRVQTRRADKSFPLISTELDRHVAERVLPDFAHRLRVDLTRAELVLGIQVRPERVYVFAERLQGAGGLPVGTLGHVLCLLSGGIDSPVAAWLAMKRGCAVSFVTFHSAPYLGEGSKRKVRRLAEALMRFQPRARLTSVPFAEAQVAIRDHAPEPYRTVLYRRMMQRIAARIARMDGAGALVTGESLGQVASQTLENLTCIGAATDMPVLRPLISFDKQETIGLARRIGTYELSIEPEPDCCTVFQPRRPVIRGRMAVCEDIEAGLDLEALVEEAVAGAERTELGVRA